MFSGISIKQMLVTAGLLALFAVIGAGLVALTFTGTRERVARNEHAELLDRLKVLVPPGSYDNDIADDTIEVTAPALLGSKRPIRVYRARNHGQPVAAILTPIAPDGYSGDIVLLVGVLYDGKLSGVRACSNTTKRRGWATTSKRSARTGLNILPAVHSPTPRPPAGKSNATVACSTSSPAPPSHRAQSSKPCTRL